MIFEDNLLEDLWLNEKSFAYFFVNGKGHWVIDHKYNYHLDLEIQARQLLDFNRIDLATFERGMRESRGGLSKLTKDNVNQYLSQKETKIFTLEQSKEILFTAVDNKELNNIYDLMERSIESGSKVGQDSFNWIELIKSRLPKYYINFDRNIFYHVDWDYNPEKFVGNDNWISKPFDFSLYIRTSDNYWIHHNNNFWKANYL